MWQGLSVEKSKMEEIRLSNPIYKKGTPEDTMSFFFNHPVFEGNDYMYFNVEEKYRILAMNMKFKDYCELQGRKVQQQLTLDAFNYMLDVSESGHLRILSGIYPEDAIKADPDKVFVKGIFYRGEAGKPLAIVIPGGGFVSNVADCEGFPYAMALHKAGYNVFILYYRIGDQLHTDDQRGRGEEAVRDLIQAVRYLTENQEALGINMDHYAIFGSSAGGMMLTAFSFSDYKDTCHKYHLPRPAVIVPIYGLDWNLEVTPQDKGLAVFSVVGRNDIYNFGAIEGKVDEIKEILGEENAEIRIWDDFPHGSGLALWLEGRAWMEDAIAFWEKHISSAE